MKLLYVSVTKIINVKDRNFISRNMVNSKERQSQEQNLGTYKNLRKWGLHKRRTEVTLENYLYLGLI